MCKRNKVTKGKKLGGTQPGTFRIYDLLESLSDSESSSLNQLAQKSKANSRQELVRRVCMQSPLRARYYARIVTSAFIRHSFEKGRLLLHPTDARGIQMGGGVSLSTD